MQLNEGKCTAWATGGDGFLVRDLNGNGKIDDISELFGNSGDGFADLRVLDANGDGVINASDAVFSKLQVWVDANSNGVTQAGELHSLGALGIKAISFAANDNGTLADRLAA